MKTDPQLQQDVLEVLKLESTFTGADISVSVEDGVVTLLGTVSADAIKTGAEDLVKKIAGVKAVNEKIQVKNDSDLAQDEDILDLSRSSPIDY